MSTLPHRDIECLCGNSNEVEVSGVELYHVVFEGRCDNCQRHLKLAVRADRPPPKQKKEKP